MTIRTWLSTGLLGTLAVAGAPNPIDRGRNIYELAQSSSPISVSLAGSSWRPAQRAEACGACHGASGEGLSEGTIAAPPLTSLATSAGDDTSAWLEAALEQGRGGAGQTLGPEMPRYRLAKDDIAALSSYLRALPQIATPGVSPTDVTISVSTEGAGLSAAGRAALASKLNALAENTRADGGIFGRSPRFDLDGAAGHIPLVVLAWQAGDKNIAYPIVSVRGTPAAMEPTSRLDCGSVDPEVSEQMRAAELWAERQGLDTILIDDGIAGDVSGKAVILMPTTHVAPADLRGAAVIFAPADLASRWKREDRPKELRIVSGGDMENRVLFARALLSGGAVDPREAVVIAGYLDGASAIVDTLRASGRRLRRVPFCENLGALVRSTRSVSIIDGANVVKILAADF